MKRSISSIIDSILAESTDKKKSVREDTDTGDIPPVSSPIGSEPEISDDGLDDEDEEWSKLDRALADSGNDINSLNKLLDRLGYTSIDDFLADNEGAIQAIYDFIGEHGAFEERLDSSDYAREKW